MSIDNVPARQRCEWCDGTGRVADWNHGQPVVVECEHCRGTGVAPEKAPEKEGGG